MRDETNHVHPSIFILHLYIRVAGPGLEPGTFGLCIPLQLSLPINRLWSGLYLHPRLRVSGACHQVSTPSTIVFIVAWLGITLRTASPTLTGYHMPVSRHAAHCKTF